MKMTVTVQLNKWKALAARQAEKTNPRVRKQASLMMIRHSNPDMLLENRVEIMLMMSEYKC